MQKKSGNGLSEKPVPDFENGSELVASGV